MRVIILVSCKPEDDEVLEARGVDKFELERRVSKFCETIAFLNVLAMQRFPERADEFSWRATAVEMLLKCSETLVYLDV